VDAFTATRGEFFLWVDRALGQSLPSDVAAFHFNLYEGVASVHVQLTGTDSFVTNPAYWPGSERYTTGEDIFEIPFEVAGSTWPEWLESIKSLISSYILSGNQSAVLRRSRGVGMGFVDGDMYVVWQSAA
jgi:hypothetical protein